MIVCLFSDATGSGRPRGPIERVGGKSSKAPLAVGDITVELRQHLLPHVSRLRPPPRSGHEGAFLNGQLQIVVACRHADLRNGHAIAGVEPFNYRMLATQNSSRS